MKLTKPQKKVIDTVTRNGCRLIQRNEGQYLSYEGSPLPKRVVNNLIKKNVVVPTGDGLFDGCTQTYEVI